MSLGIEASRCVSSDRVRKPWAIVVFHGDSWADISGSTWMNWWSSVTSANASIRAWSTSIQSPVPSVWPTAAWYLSKAFSALVAIALSPLGYGRCDGSVRRVVASIDAAAEFERLWLDEGSWVDVARGWLTDPDEVLDAVTSSVQFRQGKLFRYEKWVEEPRLGAGIGAGGQHPHPVLGDAQKALSAHYGHRFDGYGLALYRDGRDLQAFHR